MPQRVSNRAIVDALMTDILGHSWRALALDLQDARAEAAEWEQKFRDTNAALMRLQRELDQKGD